MKATLVWQVDKRQRKDGTYPLRWRLQYNGERRYYQSNTTITPKDIDKSFNVTNWDIEGRLHEDLRIFRHRIQELHLDVNLLDMDFVFTKVFGTVNPDHLEFVSWAREWVEKESEENPSLANRYATAINAFVKFKLQRTEEWYHRRIRCYIWKCWKRNRTRFKNLKKCGISRWRSWQWSNTHKGYWHIADSWILHRAIINERLASQGYPSLIDIYTKLHRN